MKLLQPKRVIKLILSLISSILLIGGAIFALTGPVQLALAASCTVTPGSAPYATIQAAVNDLNCDVITIPSGTFTENLTINRNGSLTLQGAGKTATVINGSNSDRVITISGANTSVTLTGLRVTNGNATSASSNARFGGGILVTGGATLKGETIQVDGNVANAGTGTGFGGGMAVRDGTAMLTSTMIMSNVAKNPPNNGNGEGGGLYIAGNLGAGKAILSLANSQIMNNTAHNGVAGNHGRGGGLYVGSSTDGTKITLSGNTWQGNQARSNSSSPDDGDGGAIAIDAPATVSISHDTFTNNTANASTGTGGGDMARGGAIYLKPPQAGTLITGTLTGLTLTNNVAKSGTGAAIGQGGGLFSDDGMVMVERSKFYNNKADTGGAVNGQGGGIHVRGVTNNELEFSLVNSVLAGNTVAGGSGAGLYVSQVGAGNNGLVKMIHTTIADQNLNGDEAIFFTGDASDRLRITNTIIASHTQGINNAANPLNIPIVNVLFYNNANDGGLSEYSDGGGNIFSPANQNPRFVSPAGNDYHLQAGSAAIDKGTNAGITTDIDQEPRPQGAAPDIGADEVAAKLEITKTGPSVSEVSQPITYTLSVTNSGGLTATNLLITDTIPTGATYQSGGTLMGNEVQWMVAELAPNAKWQGTFSVTATQTIVNDKYRVSADGGISATGSVAVTTKVGATNIYLPMVVKP